MASMVVCGSWSFTWWYYSTLLWQWEFHRHCTMISFICAPNTLGLSVTFFHDHIWKGTLRLFKIRSLDQNVDIFMKPFELAWSCHLVSKLNLASMLPISSVAKAVKVIIINWDNNFPRDWTIIFLIFSKETKFLFFSIKGTELFNYSIKKIELIFYHTKIRLT